MFEYLRWLKKVTTNEEFGIVLKMVDEDIKFNRIKFGKLTTGNEFIILCKRCHSALSGCI